MKLNQKVVIIQGVSGKTALTNIINLSQVVKTVRMEATSKELINRKVSKLQKHYKTGSTKSVETRISNLKRFKQAILSNEKGIYEALYNDLRKSEEETLLTEIGLVIKEIDHHIKHLRKWSKTKRVSTPLYLLPSSSHLKNEPLGVIMIIAPWNYPFQLLMNPLVGAISAGNCVMLKPSEFCIHTNAVMEKIIEEAFDTEHVTMVHGGKEANQELLSHRFDKIFFTGSPRLGKIVMKAAAEHLTPVVLELGGKSPCIVDKDANIDIAAKRIAWGKTINLGQTCIAPDYLLVHADVKEELQNRIIHYWEESFGKSPQESDWLPRMVTQEAFDRVSEYLNQGKIVHGGKTDREDKFISPTLMDNIDISAPIMDDEIFGPVLPVLSFTDIQEAIDLVNAKEKPLAYYFFGSSSKAKQMLNANTSGGACINDTIMHISNHKLPFGGVGNSGMGHYHGKYSFEVFSHQRSIVKSPTWIDLPFRYAPFKHFGIVKKLLT